MTGSSIRVLARVARRDIGRHRGRSLLVVALIALPVAAMVAGAALYRTTDIDPGRYVTGEMGRADLKAYGTGPAELGQFLPDGSAVEPLVAIDDRIAIPGARPQVTLRAMDMDGIASGVVTLLAGRPPQGSDEAAITGAVGRMAGVAIGGRIELDRAGSRTVVGLVENPLYLADRTVVVTPESLEYDDQLATWLIALPPGADPYAVVDAAQSRVAVLPRNPEGVRYDSISGPILILGSLALVEAALIASAAYAVSIRRRQRELGLLAATGATPRQLAGIVLAEGALLGLLACVAGVVVGLAGSLALTPWLDELTQHRNPPLIVDVGGLVGPMLVGFVAALLAAIIPARTVARVPVLVALSGRRPAQTPARRTLWLGFVAVGIAVVLTYIGATGNLDESPIPREIILVGGAVLSVLGFGACGPWLLERLDGIAMRLPLAGRIAFRDTARSRSRSSPIVTAILAGCAAAIALGTFQATRDEENLRGWTPAIYPDQVALFGPGAVAAGESLVDTKGVAGGTPMRQLYLEAQDAFVGFELPDARDAEGNIINTLDQCSNCNVDAVQAYQVGTIGVAAPEILDITHVPPIQADLDAGRAVVLIGRTQPIRPVTASVMEVVIQREGGGLESTERFRLPVRLIEVDVPGGVLPSGFLPDSLIERLGMIEVPVDQPFIVEYDHPVTDADIDRARHAAAQYPDTRAETLNRPERPGSEFRLLVLGLVLLFSVSVTGIAIALGEAESRPEQRSLLALGADPRLRRRIAAARAAVLALLAGVLAIPAGLLPIWGIFATRGVEMAIPTLEIAGALVALPLLAVVSSWVLSRPLPEWNAFRNLEAR